MPSDEQEPAMYEDDLAPTAPRIGEDDDAADAELRAPVDAAKASLEDEERASSADETGAYGQGVEGEEASEDDRADSSTHVYESPDATIHNVADGRGATFARDLFSAVINLGQTKEQTQKDEDEESLIELTTILPFRTPNLSELDSEEFSFHLKKLKEERLILISCPSQEVSINAAYALADNLGIPWGEQRRLLNVERVAKESRTMNLFFLRKRSDGVTAIILNALGELSCPSLDYLIFSNRLSWADFQDDLRRNSIYMLCLVDSNYVEDRFKGEQPAQRSARELQITHWRVSFLRPLLRHHFPAREAELEVKILEERKRHWWSPNDWEFYYEIKSEIETGKLLETVNSRQGARPPNPIHPRTIFKGDEPLHNIILYVATFLPNLSPREFRKVTHLLLEAQAKSMPPAPPDPVAGESIEAAHIPKKKDSMRAWMESPDGVLRDCRLVTMPLNNSIKVIGFDNFRRREELREYLERDYSLFLEQQFERLLGLGMLFSPSARVADGMMRLVMEMASAYPDDYGARWLAETVKGFKQVAESSNDASHDSETDVFQTLGVADSAQAKKLVSLRASELLRRMLEAPGMEGAVDTFFQQLISSKNFKLVFEIVKRLQLAPNFDEFRWLKQLVERGDPETRSQVYGYLFGYLKKVRSKVYQILWTLESWLPEPTKLAESYSVSNKYALRLLLAYCLGTTLKFEEKLFGCWPSQYPLFSFSDVETANRNLDLLTKWLFHPGMSVILRERNISWNSVGALTVKWIFILLDRDEASSSDIDCGTASTSPNGTTAEGQFSALDVRDILLAQMVLNAEQVQHHRLLTYWEESVDNMLDAITEAPYGSEARDRLVRRRDILADTVTKFRALQYELGGRIS